MTAKMTTFADMTDRYVDIHTHRPTGRHIELRTAGIHPWNAGTEELASLPPLSEAVQAIGEIGLDRLHGPTLDRQTELFRRQLAIAERRQLPVVLHCVRAFEPMMQVLADYRLPAVIFHGFIGSPEQAARAIDRGYCLSFGLRSLRSGKTRGVLAAIPGDSLFLETDDDPTPIERIYAQAAILRGTEIEALRATILLNYKRIFERKSI